MQEKIYVRAVLAFIVVLIIANIYTWYPRIVGEKKEELIPVTVNSPVNLHDNFFCERGQLQSPIEIRNEEVKTKSEKSIQFQYKPTVLKMYNGKSTIHASPEEKNVVKVNDEEFTLVDIHFHYPSEHMINGKYYNMEMHLVHENKEGNKVVVAALFEEGQANEVISHFFNGIPYHQETVTKEKVDLPKLIQKQKAFNYIGSLTTPPCTEGVEWIVLNEPFEISKSQLTAYTEQFPQNNRPIQQLNNREIKEIIIID